MRLRTTVQQPEAEDVRRQEREALRDQQRLNEAMRSGKPELERLGLTFRRFGEVVHDDGRRFRLVRGEVVDAKFVAFDAWYIDPFGRAEFLQAEATR